MFSVITANTTRQKSELRTYQEKASSFINTQKIVSSIKSENYFCFDWFLYVAKLRIVRSTYVNKVPIQLQSLNSVCLGF